MTCKFHAVSNRNFVTSVTGKDHVLLALSCQRPSLQRVGDAVRDDLVLNETKVMKFDPIVTKIARCVQVNITVGHLSIPRMSINDRTRSVEML